MAVKFSNSAATTFSVGVLIGDSTVTVNDATEFPTVGGADYCYATFSNTSDIEIVKVTAIAGSVLTITRAQEGTSAAAFNIGDACQLRVTAGMLTDALAEREAADATILKDADIASTVQAYSVDLTGIAGLGNIADNEVLVGTGAGTYAYESSTTLHTSLGLAIGTNVQAYDADLAALAGLTSAADKLPYFTGSGTAAVATFSSFDRTSLLGNASEAAFKAAVNLEIGTDVQAEDAGLTSIAALSTIADNEVIVGTGAGTYAHESGATLLSSIGALASGDTSIGKHSIWVPATAMTPTTTNGATAAATNETTATRPDIVGAAFSGVTSQFMQFLIAMPESWDGVTSNTLTFKAVYAGLDAAAAYATDTVKWTLQLISFVDDESADTAFTTAVTTITDTTPSAVEDIAVTAVSGAVTVDGTKTAGSNILIGRVGRDIADTMDEDATLIGYLLTYTTDGGVDA
jgi:hypothetical protein